MSSRRRLVHPDLLLGVVIGLLGLALRLAFFFQAPPLLQLRDSASYALPALALLSGEAFNPELKRPPLYPLFLASSFGVFGENLRAPLALQHVVGAATAGLTYWLARRLWGRAMAVLAGLVTAINGGLVFQEQAIMAESLFALLLVAALLMASAIQGPRRFPWAAVTGVLVGLATLSRPSALVLAPLFAVTLAATGAPGRRIALAGVLLFGTLGTILPWMIRNQVVHGTFTVASGLGEALISRTRHHDRTAGATAFVPPQPRPDDRFSVARRWLYRQLPRTDEADVLFRGVRNEFGLSERDADQLLREVAVKAILDNPHRYVLTTARMGLELFVGWDKPLSSMWETAGKRKVQEEWGPRAAHLFGPDAGAQERDYVAAETLVGLYQHHRVSGLLGVLFVAGASVAVATVQYRPALPTIATVLVLLGLSVATAGPLFRYRVSLEPLIAIAAVGGLVALRDLARALLRARLTTRAALRYGPHP